MLFPTKQLGSAIITTLLMVSLIVILAVAMIERFRIDVHRTAFILNANKNYLIAQGEIAWAMDFLNSHPVIEKTPVQFKTSIIEDAQKYFNINNLIEVNYRDEFLRLLQAKEPTLDAEKANAILLATIDWISPEKNKALEEYYTKLNPPYRPAHRLMASISEWRLVKGVTPELFTKLLPYLIALPPKSSTTSNYFLVQTNGTVYTLLERTLKDNKFNTIIIWQSKGTM